MRAALVLLACAAACGHAAPGLTDERTLAELVRRGNDAYRRGDHSAYLDLARKAAALSPANPDLEARVARALVLSGQGEAGLAVLDRVLALGVAYDLDRKDWDAVRATPAFAAARERVARSLLPRRAGALLFSLPAPDVLAEAIAWDEARRCFYVSSVHQHRVLRVDEQGAVSDLLAPSAERFGLLGVAFDPARRRLWVGAAALPQVDGHLAADEGRSAVLAVDVDRGVVTARLEPADRGHSFGDVALAPDGSLWASDSRGGGIWRAPPDGSALVPVVPPGRLRSPQGLAFAADGRRAFVADYPTGLYTLDLETLALAPVALPPGTLRYGMDGVARAGARLLVVENGASPHRLLALDLDPTQRTVTGAAILESGPALLGPTSGTIAGDAFVYIAVSQWESFDDDGGRRGEAPVEIRRIPLP